MKKLLLSLGFSALLATSSLFASNNANVQIVHNCADTLAKKVDVWVNGAKLLPNVSFRTATDFLPLDVRIGYEIGIAPGGSATINDTLRNFSFPAGAFMADTNYVVIASGLLATTSYAANPDGVDRKFQLIAIANAKTSAPAGKFNLAVVHGATDAPAVDVKDAFGKGTKLVAGAKYSDATGYLTIDAGTYDLDITQKDSTAVIADYTADLSSLGGGAGVVLASGFLNPAVNANGAAFGLFLTPSAAGALIALPSKTKTSAFVQVIHNAADTNAKKVDVYINGVKRLTNFAFGAATGYLPITTNYGTRVHICGPNSNSIADSVLGFAATLTTSVAYVVTAVGLLNSTGYAANPSGISTKLQLLVKTPVRTSPLVATNVDFFVIHACTDAPAVDLKLYNRTVLASGAKYTDQTGYFTIGTNKNDTVLVYAAGGTTPLKAYLVPATLIGNISPTGGAAAVVTANGFLTPTTNKSGPAFGLTAYFADGTPFPLNEISIPTSIEEVSAATLGLRLAPNPASDNLAIQLNLDEKASVSVEMMDLSGRVIKAIDQNIAAGNQAINTSVADMANGIYLAKVTVNNKLSVVKFVIHR